jgi:hypothetical protein
MMPTTVEAFAAICKADPTITPEERARLVALLRRGPEAKAVLAPTQPAIVRRADAAKRLGCSLRALDLWSKQGVLKKVKLPGRTRNLGFLEADITRLISPQEAS